MNPIYLGCDPDLHSTSFAIIDDEPKVLLVHVCRVHKKYKQRAAVTAAAHAIRQFITTDFSLLEIEDMAVEAQEVAYTARSGRNPRDIVLLANVAGIAIGELSVMCPTTPLSFPTPQAWKGNVPKQIHQARIMEKLKWTYQKVGSKEDGYCAPVTAFPDNKSLCEVGGVDELNKGDWKHVNDAIGLALYAREQSKTAKLRASQLEKANVPSLV